MVLLYLVFSAIVYGSLEAGASFSQGRDALALWRFASRALLLAALVPAALLAARIAGRPAGTVVSATGRLRWGWLFRSVAVAAAI